MTSKYRAIAAARVRARLARSAADASAAPAVRAVASRTSLALLPASRRPFALRLPVAALSSSSRSHLSPRELSDLVEDFETDERFLPSVALCEEGRQLEFGLPTEGFVRNCLTGKEKHLVRKKILFLN
jgi:hypothetical protein